MRQATYLDLVYEYFKTDILTSKLSDDLRHEIISTFEYAFNKKQRIEMLVKELKGSELEAIRNRQLKRIESNYNPYPIRLGELKPILQREAADNDCSLHCHMTRILRNHCFGEHYIFQRRIFKMKRSGNPAQLPLSLEWLN